MVNSGKDIAVLCGLDSQHIVPFGPNAIGVHSEVVEPLRFLSQAAADAGFELRLASGFRDFSRQASIWNAKASGSRPLLDGDGRRLDGDRLSAGDKLMAILRWSMLPGASRHHWGTDIDVYDAAAVPDDYRLQLEPSEYTGDGPFARFNGWLDQRIAQGKAFGFVRPYGKDRGGVAPEPWHLSYGPLSRVFQQLLDVEVLRSQIECSSLLLKEDILSQLDDIYQRFVSLPTDFY